MSAATTVKPFPPAVSASFPTVGRTLLALVDDPVFGPGLPTAFTASAGAVSAFGEAARKLSANSAVGQLIRSRSYPDPTAGLVAELVGSLQAGGAIPDDLVERAETAEVSRQGTAAALRVLDTARDRVEQDFLGVACQLADDIVAGPVRTEHDRIAAAYAAADAAAGGRPFDDASQFVGAPPAAQRAYAAVRELVRPMARVRLIQRAFADLDTVTGLGPAQTWDVGGWALPFALHFPEVQSWAVGTAATWWQEMDQRTGAYRDLWPTDDWERFLLTMRRGSRCLTLTEVADQFGVEYRMRHPTQLVNG